MTKSTTLTRSNRLTVLGLTWKINATSTGSRASAQQSSRSGQAG